MSQGFRRSIVVSGDHTNYEPTTQRLGILSVKAIFSPTTAFVPNLAGRVYKSSSIHWKVGMTNYIKRFGMFGVLATISSLAQVPSAPTQEDYWSALTTSSHKMHATMDSVQKSGDCDADFVKLMLSHHQAAIEMAKVQLLYGKDPQVRRLAQEIITDQQSEIDLMQLWLKKHRL